MVELKHLAPYLPYGLKMFYTSVDGREQMSWTLRDGTLTEAIVNQNKPILRTLSDLTKEIEVGGERFVPMIELAKIQNTWTKEEDESRIYLDKYEGDGVSVARYNTASPIDDILLVVEFYDMKALPYKVIEKLFEWKFDLFKLIESGDAIDINTL